MTDTTTLAPTAAELMALSKDCMKMRGGAGMHYENYARAVLSKWGAPAPASGEPVAVPAGFEPVAAESRFETEREWGRCTVEHHNFVQAHQAEWPGYVTRGLYTLAQMQAMLAAPPAQEARVPLNVDALAQEIRRVDGNHSLGAGALAEALLPWITAAQKEAPNVP